MTISFLCETDYEINKLAFRLNSIPTLLPVFVQIPKEIQYKGLQKDDINILWVSRLDLDKVRILNLLIRDIDDFNADKSNYAKITLHIVGDGKSRDLIYRPITTGIIFHGILSKHRLWNFASSNIDCSFGVGTSALEIGAQGIPTFLIPSMDHYSFYSRHKPKGNPPEK